MKRRQRSLLGKMETSGPTPSAHLKDLLKAFKAARRPSSTATPGWTGSCINTIGNNALQVTSQVGGAGGMPHVAAFVTKRWVF